MPSQARQLGAALTTPNGTSPLVKSLNTLIAMTALLMLVVSIVVCGVAGVLFVTAHGEASDARHKASLAAEYNYRACIDRNEMRSTMLTLVEAQLSAGRLDQVERALFRESRAQLRPSDCLKIRRAIR